MTYTSSLIALPQLNCLLSESVIPAAFLELIADMDWSNQRPENQFKSLVTEINALQLPMTSSLASFSFYLKLAREANVTGLKKCLFNPDFNITCATIPYSALLEACRYGYHEDLQMSRGGGHGATDEADLLSNDSDRDWIARAYRARAQGNTLYALGTMESVFLASLQSKDFAGCIDLILSHFASSVTNHNRVLERTEAPQFMHSRYLQDHGHFV